MGETGPAWAAALESSGLGVLMRESAVLYPIANVAHILGLILLAGSMVVLDLRLMGFGRAMPALAVSRAVTPIALTGFAVMVASGIALFAADARPMANNPVLPVKAGLILFAILNAGLFRLLWNARLPMWDTRPAKFGQAQAALSLAAWLAAAACGRLLAYF